MSDAPNPDAPVLARIEGAVGRLTLNRPAALHALNAEMCRLMITSLQAWRANPAVQAILIDHSGERGFCAGGDIRMLAESGAGDGAAARDFFYIEYQLNALLMELRHEKPVIAVIDGVTMGGGVGISMPARYRVATERTTFAMPETGIGLFPDVGGGWHLPRLHGKVGLWLALTGARLKAADCELLGIATDVIESARTGDFKAAVVADPAAVERILTEMEVDPGRAPVSDHRDAIDSLFGHDSVEAIFAALEADGSDWARAQLDTLKTKSPQTMKVAFRQLQQGAEMQRFSDNMVMEFRIGARVVQLHDFIEGVRAVIIDKDNAPKWDPATLAGVTPAMLEAIFAPLPDEQEWRPLL